MDSIKFKQGITNTVKGIGNFVKRNKEKEPDELSEYERALSHLNEVQDKYEVALQNFENASPDFVDIAIHQLKIAEDELNFSLKRLKKLYYTNEVEVTEMDGTILKIGEESLV